MADRQNLRAMLRGKNVFVEGVGFIGRVGDIEPPKIEFEMAEDGNMGRNVDSGLLKAMECKITVYDFNEVLFGAVGKRLQGTASFVIKSSMATNDGQTPVYFEVAGQVKAQEFDNLKDTSKESGVSLDISVVRYKLEIGGKEHYDIDTDAMVCKIAGVDHFDTLRKQVM